MARPALLLLLAAGATTGAAQQQQPQPLPPTRLRADGSDVRLRQPHADFAVASAAPLFEWAPQHAAAAAPAALPPPEGAGTNVLWAAGVQLAEADAAADLLRQTAFELRVADAVTGDAAWRSGVVRSAQPSARYPLTAPALRGGREYEWSVRWHDGAGAVSPWSAAAAFRTPLAPSQWDGVAWVGSHEHNLYRSEFDVPAGVRAATLFICGLGWSRPLLNGQAPTDAVLTTAPWRNNERSNGYSSLDVLHTLVAGGRNTLGVALGHGWRVLRRDPLEVDPHNASQTEASGDGVTRVLRAQLVLTLADNSTTVATKTGDASWTATAGPVVSDHIYVSAATVGFGCDCCRADGRPLLRTEWRELRRAARAAGLEHRGVQAPTGRNAVGAGRGGSKR